MKDELHRHLDGEPDETAMDAGIHGDAHAWGRMLEAFRVELASTPSPPWLETRVMAEIEALPEAGLLARVGKWLLAPRPLRVSPLLVGATVTAVVALLFLGIPTTPGPAQVSRDDVVVYVQFALEAPGAQSVAVAGDFDGWAGSHALEDGNGAVSYTHLTLPTN